MNSRPVTSTHSNWSCYFFSFFSPMNLEEEKNRIPVSTDSPINVDLFVRIYIDKHLFGFSEWFWNSFISYLRKSLCAIATILARNKNGVSTRRLESHRCTSNIITFINRVFFSFFFGVLNPSSPERDPFFSLFPTVFKEPTGFSRLLNLSVSLRLPPSVFLILDAPHPHLAYRRPSPAPSYALGINKNIHTFE